MDKLTEQYNWSGLTVKVTTESGHSWTTDINGDLESAIDYFIGQQFNVGIFPAEVMERAVKVEVLK